MGLIALVVLAVWPVSASAMSKRAARQLALEQATLSVDIFGRGKPVVDGCKTKGGNTFYVCRARVKLPGDDCREIDEIQEIGETILVQTVWSSCDYVVEVASRPG